MHRLKLASVALALLLTAGMAACPDPARAPDAAGTQPAAQPNAAATQAAASDLDPSTVVATIEGEKITLGQVEKEIEGELRQAELQYRSQLHELREQAIERFVAKRLLTEEAKRRGLADDEALIRQEIEESTPAPTEEEVRAFYEQNQARMGGAAFEDAQPRIVEFLQNQKKREKFAALMESLQQKAKVDIDLPSPRMQVEAKGPAMGPENAPVSIVVFSDFECPYCSRAVPTLHQVNETYGDKVRVVFRHFPLPFHANAPKASEAAACAAEQGKFWEMHDKLFENQKALAVEDLKGHAKAIEGLDAAKLEKCLDSGEMAKVVEADLAAGKEVGVTGTPAFFINGIQLSGAQPFEAFKEVIDNELARAGKQQ